MEELGVRVLPQPDDSTCGPTCLHAVYDYWSDPVDLEVLIAEVRSLPDGGTLGVSLASHALRRGYAADIYSYDLQLLDPTWFAPGVDLADKLRRQKALKSSKKLAHAADAFLEFLHLGGRVRIEELTEALIARHLERGVPVLTGLSATYLYGCAREHERDYDDLRGRPVGHFVLISGYDRTQRQALVADPLHDNPGFGSPSYRVDVDRLIASILLGIVTYDANLVVISPKKR